MPVIDKASEAEWGQFLTKFSDANIYQTWAYGQIRWGAGKVSRLVLQAEGEPVALAQVRMVRFPLLPCGIAHVTKGPVWQVKNKPADLECLRAVLNALRKEYAVRRGMALKVTPNLLEMDNHPALEVFRQEGFECNETRFSTNTIVLDLSPGLQELRGGFRQKWRQYLNNSERAGIELVEGTETELYEVALQLYHEMHERKQFVEFVNQEELREIQKHLPPEAKMRILIGKMNGTPIAAIVWSVLGDTGLPLLAATGQRALENDASYLMWWKMLEWLKNHGYRYCDLGGINPERNPGGYHFKSGIGKKHGREVRWLGEFECCHNPLSRGIVQLATWSKKKYTNLKLRLEKARQLKRQAGRNSESARSGTPPQAAAKHPGRASELDKTSEASGS